MQKLPQEATNLSHELNKKGHVDETVIYMQVDRVLGCRVQGNYTGLSRHLSVNVADDLCSEDLLISENQNRLSEENSACDTDLDVGVVENHTEGCQTIDKSFDREESMKNEMKVDKIHADFLARLGLLLDSEFVVFSSPPVDLTSLLEADAVGLFVSRLCPAAVFAV